MWKTKEVLGEHSVQFMLCPVWFDCARLKHDLMCVSSSWWLWEQVLASALNANLFPFVLDLACLAAKREFLKLDKWITDKIKDNQVR